MENSIGLKRAIQVCLRTNSQITFQVRDFYLGFRWHDHTDDKWPLRTLFLVTFDPHLSIIKSMFDCCLPGVFMG